MATNPSTDLTEEDAADLQFPKECHTLDYDECLSSSNSTYSTNNNDLTDLNRVIETCDVCLNTNQFCSCYKCSNCQKSLRIPFIACAECENISLCNQCFARGCELLSHKNNHSYRVLQHDFILFDNSNWTAEEELVMLDVLYTYGYGNWEIISKKLKNRSPREIKDHYDRFYIDMYRINKLPKVPETEQSLFPKPVIPYKYRLCDIEEPPRYAPDTNGYNLTAGYNAARSEFELEYDSNAEDLLSLLNEKEVDINDFYYNIFSELQCGIIRSYNRRLKERERRRKIMRTHGLILIRKTISWLHRYEKTLTRSVAERLLCFMQFFSGIQFDYVVESLHRVAELKQRVSRLKEYRRKGIKTLLAAEVYENIKQEREQLKKELNAFESNSFFNWKTLENPIQQQTSALPNKRSHSKPLDIIGLPGYEKLLRKEQELCSTVRLVPQTYIELKELLIAESKRNGHLKLQTARRMLKIDVNKTRKLYDFLVQEGYVVKSNN